MLKYFYFKKNLVFLTVGFLTTSVQASLFQTHPMLNRGFTIHYRQSNQNFRQPRYSEQSEITIKDLQQAERSLIAIINRLKNKIDLLDCIKQERQSAHFNKNSHLFGTHYHNEIQNTHRILDELYKQRKNLYNISSNLRLSEGISSDQYFAIFAKYDGIEHRISSQKPESHL